MCRVFSKCLFLGFLVLFVPRSMAGELVIGIQEDVIPKSPFPTWDQIFMKRGFIKLQSSGFEGVILSKKVESETFVFVASRLMNSTPQSQLVIEAINARTGQTVLFEILRFGEVGVPQRISWMTQIAARIESATIQHKPNTAIPVGFSGDEPMEGEAGTLFVDFKQKILKNDSIIFLNRNLSPNVLSLQDHFIIDGWKKDNRIHGHFYSAEALCKITVERGPVLKLNVCDPSSSQMIGKVTVSDVDDIEQAINKIYLLVSGKSGTF